MPTLIGRVSASLLHLTTSPDGRSMLPNWIVTALATFAETELPKGKKPGSIDESLVWRAVTLYQAASGRRDQSATPIGWQKAADGTLAVQVLPQPESELQRRALLELESVVQSTTINHPGLAPVIRTAFNQGYPYLAARLNQTAESLTRRFGLPMDPAQAMDLTEQVAEALEYAHHRGLVHGSLSLDDILVSDTGRLTVLGVGVDQLRQLLGAPSTAPSTALTPPEVQAGEQADMRADVFAVGALLFVLLTGKMPAMGKPVALSRDIPAVPPAVDAVLTKALAADPEQRYADLFEMSTALRVAIRSPRAAPARPAAAQSSKDRRAVQPAGGAAQTSTRPSTAISGFPDALPMPEVDLAVFDQRLEMPVIASAEAATMPVPSPMPVVDWDSLLRPVDLSALGGLAIELPVDQSVPAAPDPMLAAVQAVRLVEAKPPKASRSKSVPAQSSPAQPPVAASQPSTAAKRPARKRKPAK